MPEARRKKRRKPKLYEVKAGEITSAESSYSWERLTVAVDGYAHVGDATCRKCGFVTGLYVEDGTDRLVRFSEHSCEQVEQCTDPKCDHRHITLTELSTKRPRRKR